MKNVTIVVNVAAMLVWSWLAYQFHFIMVNEWVRHPRTCLPVLPQLALTSISLEFVLWVIPLVWIGLGIVCIVLESRGRLGQDLVSFTTALTHAVGAALLAFFLVSALLPWIAVYGTI